MPYRAGRGQNLARYGKAECYDDSAAGLRRAALRMARPRDPSHQLASSKGDIHLSWPRPEVLLVRLTGHFDMKLGKFMLDAATRCLDQQKRVQVFCDWSDATGYDSDVRVSFTNWVASNQGRTKFHMLVTSKIVAMGVSVANLALGGSLAVFNNRPAFESALRVAKSGLPSA